ncbi:MAG: flagellar protein [Verrucomicrobiota bacterium]
MIKITDLRGEPVWLNPDLIERIQTSPDTIVSLLTGSNMMVQERPEEIAASIAFFRRACHPASEPASKGARHG